MIKHIVMWKLADEADGMSKSESINRIESKLISLTSVIEEISSLEFGINFNPTEAAYDLVLITTHKDKDALEAYINHPSHQEAAKLIGKLVVDRKVVDFEQ